MVSFVHEAFICEFFAEGKLLGDRLNFSWRRHWIIEDCERLDFHFIHQFEKNILHLP